MGRKTKYKKTSKFHGIHYDFNNKKWKVYAKNNTYLGYYDTEPEAIIAQQKNKTKSRSKEYRTRKVYQCNQYLEIIHTFKSIKEASQQTNTNAASIRKCCNYQQQTANNYYWFWINDTITKLK